MLTELGRAAEAEEAFRRAAASVAPPRARAAGAGGGAARQPARRAGRRVRRGRRAGPGHRAVPSARSSWARRSTICATGWRGCCSRRAGRSRRATRWRRCSGRGPTSSTREAALGLAHYLSGDARRGARGLEERASRAGPRTPGSRPTSRCWDAPARDAGWALAAALPAPRPAAACGGATASGEGDEAYGRGALRGGAAGSTGRSAGGDADARVWAKVGAAALRTRRAARGHGCLPAAGRRGSRPGLEEAAEGLEAVARAAERAGDGGGAPARR